MSFIMIEKAKRGYPRIHIPQTSQWELIKFKEVVGCGRIWGPRWDGNPHHKSRWEFSITKTVDVLSTYEKMKPWLSPKKIEQAERVFEQMNNQLSPYSVWKTKNICSNGHDKTDAYVYKGARLCRECLRINSRKTRLKKKMGVKN